MTEINSTHAIIKANQVPFNRPIVGIIHHFDPYRITSPDPEKTLARMLEIINDDYQGMLTAKKITGYQTVCDIGKSENIWSVTDTAEFRNRFVDMVIMKVPVIDAFLMSYKITNGIRDAFGIDGHAKDTLTFEQKRETFSSRITMAIAREFLDDFINTWEDEGVLWVTTLFPTYALSLSRKVKAIITTAQTGQEQSLFPLFESFGLPVIYVNRVIPDRSRITIDGLSKQVSIVDAMAPTGTVRLPVNHPQSRHLTLLSEVNDAQSAQQRPFGQWFSGAALTGTSAWAVSTGRPLTQSDQEAILKDLYSMIGDDPFFVRMPDFRPGCCPFPGDPALYSDPAMLMSYKSFFETHLRAVAAVLNPGKTAIILPLLGHPEEFAVWKTIILSVYAKSSDIFPRIGVMIESEPLIDAYDTFDAADFIIFNLDEITIELFDSPAETCVMRTLKTTLRDMHQRFRERNIDHYIMGKTLSHPHVMERVLKMGFRGIIISPGAIPSVAQVIDDFLGNKDKFRGIHARRLANKDNNQQNNE